MRSTIKDVSREAGVSIKTVSRVLNKERYVGAATREKVEAAVAALNFRPSHAARSLAGRRSFQVALVCDNPSPHYVYEMQSGIRDRCEADGVRMLAQPYDRGSAKLLNAIEALVDTTHLDGIILTPPVTDIDAVLDLLANRQMRVVRVSPGANVDATASTFIDNPRAATEMMRHLIALGHRRIAHIAGPSDFATSAQRRRGYEIALAAAGISPDPALIVAGDYDFASGARAADMLLSLSIPPTAIFAGSDDMAAGALAAAHRLGVAVPGSVSIAGFGDDALAGYVWPPLTTIRQPVRALGWNAADLLLAAEPTTERRELPYELIVRGSTAQPIR
ncbi:LacI family DNA-binding transcriptional regulator [Sphingomonas sp. SUN019]|uniref:LacI family DNA-binding transcriptional regulator n=1 Tax=Sphingomonas sp. SUN019 TaxID=2937788 RepID=UPI002164EAC2|nr:LacI family DNA-binding transcriptional regulator [Sphingomonas sp. SUN019]UVO50808.1 LacI family DNA-binding transcriptional regulator [Sphingomonas sp. SUN019]